MNIVIFKALFKECRCFKYLRKKFSALSKAKLKKEIFVDPANERQQFEMKENAKEKEAWLLLKVL